MTLLISSLWWGLALPPGIFAQTPAFASGVAKSTCGDTAGRNGKDIRCSCGDTVVTNTVLETRDPVVNQACPTGGLSIATGVVLDLGGNTLTGSGRGVGVAIADGGTVRNGTVRGFHTGVAALDGLISLRDLLIEANAGRGLVVGQPGGESAPDVTLSGAAATVSDNGRTGIVVHPAASLTLNGEGGRVASLRNGGRGLVVHGVVIADLLEVGQNAGQGVLVDTTMGIVLRGVDVHDNGGNGIYVLRAEGPSVDNCLTALPPLTSFTLRAGCGTPPTTNRVYANQGDGIVLGDQAAQTGAVVAQVKDTEIVANGAARTDMTLNAGLRIEQKDDSPASTHWFVAANNIHDNLGEGVHLRSSFPLPASPIARQAFISNLIHHNGQPDNPTCSLTGASGAPQMWVEGRTPFSDPLCPCTTAEGCTSGPTTEFECEALTDPQRSPDGVAHWCVFQQAAGVCRTAYPLRGDCVTASPNAFFNYPGTGLNIPLTCGLFASAGAAVDVSGNLWAKGGRDGQDWCLSNDPDSVVAGFSCHPPPAVCP